MFRDSDLNSAPLYNSRIVDNYIRLISKEYPHINIKELLQHANMSTYEVADEGHWFSQTQINKFHEKLSQFSNNKNISREAGRYAASPDAIGRIRPFILGMLEPHAVYKLVKKIGSRFTRATNFEYRKLASNRVEITVSPLKGIKENSFQCENRAGFLEAIASIFTNKLPKIEHKECMHKGSSACKYIISWEKSISIIFKRFRNYALIFLLPLNIILAIYTTILPTITIISTSISLVLIIGAIGHFFETKELKTTVNYLKDSTDQLIDQIETNYINAKMTNEIGQAISKQKKIGDILHSIVQVFKKSLDYDRCLILLSEKNNKQLSFRTGFGYTFDQLKILKETAFHLDRPDARGIFVVAFHDQKSFLINDVNEIEADLSARSLAFSKRLGSHSFIVCPIISDGKSIGILAVDNLKSKRPLIQSDLSLLSGISSVLGICIRNAELIEAKNMQFKSLLHVLAASIDARDPMTSGHSEKVTEYAVGICDELGLDPEYREVIRISALLHDYGKIGVPDAILKKRGKLNESEYEIVKNHVEKTKRILEQVSFEGIFSEVPNIAGAHHERYDGNGYPKGLKGKEIPFGSRIIAAADFFDAITSRRPYRDPMSLNKAMRLLLAERGKKLDPKVVGALICFLSKSFAINPEYRAMINKCIKIQLPIDQ